MFILDAELGSEGYNFKIKKTKTEIKKEPEDSTVNGKKKLKKSTCKTELINVLQMKTQ